MAKPKIYVQRCFRVVEDDCQFYKPQPDKEHGQCEFAKALGRENTECPCKPDKFCGTDNCPFFIEERSVWD